MPKFKDYPEFTPNLTPKQIFSLGSFIDWGGYWRDIYSGVLEKRLSNQHKEFKFLKDVPEHLLVNPEKDYKKYNRYSVKAGSSLKDWESKDWLHEQDPYGWVQWYCRFYNGRRMPHIDEIQIKRWKNFRRHVMAIKKNCEEGDLSCRRRQRQAILQWSYNPFI